MIDTKKSLATAEIVDPTLVAAKAAQYGNTAHPGAIWVKCLGHGFYGTNLIYCRYGLGIDFYKVQIGQEVLIEPTFGGKERWFYTGLVDGGGNFTSSAADQVMIKSLLQELYMATAGTMHLSAKAAAEPFVLGAKIMTYLSNLKAIFDAHIHVTTATVGAGAVPGIISATGTPMPAPAGDELSTKIFGE